MKKRVVALLLCSVMAVGLLAGCGSKKEEAAAPAATTEAAAPEEAEAEAPAEVDSAYPEGPITCIIPYAPGGGSDVLLRTVMKYIALPNGQNLVAVNVEGASGFTGAMQCFNSKNDGYNIMTHNLMDVISYTLNKTTDQNLWADLTTICGIVDDFNVLATNPATGWTSVDDVVEYVNAHPGEVKVSNTGNNNTNMADCIRVLEALGIYDKVTVVPYDGGTANSTALLGEHVQLGVSSQSDFRANIEGGGVIPLMTVGDRRSEYLPDVPCTKELGYDIVTTKPRGLYGPADMDPAHVQVIADAVKVVCENPEFQAEIVSLGYETLFQTGDELYAKTEAWYNEMVPYFEMMLEQ